MKARDLLLVLEYQRDGFGAAGEQDYAKVRDSARFFRGELQVLGRDEAAIQTSFFGLGASDLAPGASLPSEYGLVPTTAYISLSFFF